MKTTVLKLFSSAILATNGISAMATVITFDDIVTNGTYVEIQNGYGGLTWDNFYAIDSNFHTGSGYQLGTVSQPNTAFNSSADPASFSSASAFNLTSIEVTKAWSDGFTHFDGYVGSTLTYSMDVFSTTTAPTLALFNWSGLSKVTMSDGNFTSQTAIDNLTVSAVPEPETYAMLLAGLGLIGTIARRRKSKQA